MERFYKRKEPQFLEKNDDASKQKDKSGSKRDDDCGKKQKNDDVGTMRENDVEVNLLNLPMDPGLRHPISYYNVNIQDQVRRQYLQNGPCQPKTHNFPLRHFGKQSRRFNSSWFDKYGNWLEYSIAKDAAFCLCCYLFKPEIGEQAGGESFTKHGFTNWKKPERLRVHVGCSNSVHNDAWRSCQDLMKQEQHIQTMYSRHSNQTRSEYRARLQASIDCVRFLLRQGLAFRGHDESEESSNRGNFLELLKFLADHNEDIKAVTLENAPSFLKVTCPDTQKDIVSACAIETTNAIIREMGDAFFSILVDESRDVSIKEQMAIVLRYVNISGQVVERFIGIEQVGSTTAQSLKEAIDRLFSRHGLSMSRVRGQGYDGASNMQGEFNGLKTIILRENECAYYIHCFAHQLQLALIVVAKNHIQIESFFAIIANVVNVVGASSKRCDALREKHAEEVVKALNLGDLSSGQGLNQETTLKRCGDTRWGSHYNTLLSIINMFSAVISVLEMIIDDGPKSGQRGEAKNLLELMLSFNFVFCLHLMRNILGATDELSQALQRKDQDIVNAMNLVRLCKLQLQTMRQSGWNSLIDEVTFFCAKHDIDVPNMDDMFVDRGRSRRKAQEITNLHRYRVELYYAVLDMQLQELNSRFNETNTELLLCLACLSPNDLFSAFNKQKLLRLAQLYPNEFSTIDIMALEIQLDTYILDMRTSGEFSELKDIGDLAKRMVETKRHNVYPLVYLLITLALTLPVATASVERAFSAMNILKNRLRNRMGEQWMNDSLVVYIEKDLFNNIDNEVVMQRYQCMKTRKGQL